MRDPSRIDVIDRRSPRLFRLFRSYARRYVARHFHALRVALDGPVPQVSGGPLIVVLNHPSWWDPLIAIVMTEAMPAGLAHYGPIEAVGLAQYPFLSRLGFFGFETDTTAGAARFLRTSLAILSRPDSVLWITAQGRFVDPRERPTRLRPGIGHLAHRLGGASIVPMALEYPFWNDRGAEVLVRFGRPVEVEDGRALSPRDWTAHIGRALEAELDSLAIAAIRRDPGAFRTLFGGTAGVGGVYDTWRRLRAWLGGRSFHAEHATRPPFPDGRDPTA